LRAVGFENGVVSTELVLGPAELDLAHKQVTVRGEPLGLTRRIALVTAPPPTCC
jgi:hypothetical protein